VEGRLRTAQEGADAARRATERLRAEEEATVGLWQGWLFFRVLAMGLHYMILGVLWHGPPELPAIQILRAEPFGLATTPLV
jgi:hypothetical protein